MKIYETTEVFGVKVEQLASYIDREEVDSEFMDAINSDREIVVYGSSKQGKTALVHKHLPYQEQIVVRLSPSTTLVDIYKSVVRQCKISIVSERVDGGAKTEEVSLGAKIRAVFPIFGEVGLDGGGKSSDSSSHSIKFEEISYNLELAQDVCELLKKIDFKKFVILENFHYLPEDRQQLFAYDLRTFQESGIRFVILGVWREKNRLTQYNGDLDDRLKEISVEPWHAADFKKVANKGACYLNIKFCDVQLKQMIESAFGSIGVFQEILKEYCLKAGVKKSLLVEEVIGDDGALAKAIEKKAKEYASRHERSLVAIAAGAKSYAPRQGQPPLYLPYYLVKVVLKLGFDGLEQGIEKSKLQEEIKNLHYRPDDVRTGDVTNLLSTIAALQHKKGISPPVLDYNKEEKKLQVVDSTFFFYLKNGDLIELFDGISEPFGNYDLTGGLFDELP